MKLEVKLLENQKISELLGKSCIGPSTTFCLHLEECDSTQSILKEQFKTNSNLKWALVSTKIQNKGRGRQGSPWVTQPDALMFSGLIAFPEEKLTLAPLFLVNQVCDYFNRSYSSALMVKWPNDIYFQNQKIGGIICEHLSSEHGVSKIVFGIGINTRFNDSNHKQLREWASFKIDRNSSQQTALIEDLYEKILETPVNSNLILDEWQNLCCHLNQKVFIHNQGQVQAKGVFKGLGEYGDAILESQSGEKLNFLSGSLKIDEN